MRWLLVPVALLILPSVARADPCEDQLPFRQGETFSGVIRYIGDSDSLCLGPSRDPMTWTEVRLSDFDAPEHKASGGRDARDLLSRTVCGRVLACAAVRGRNGRVIVQDRVIDTCRLNGHGVGDLLHASSGRGGGR